MIYATFEEIYGDKVFPIMVVNENGEAVLIDKGENYFKTRTAQNNNRVRVNVYWQDSTTEEFFEEN